MVTGVEEQVCVFPHLLLPSASLYPHITSISHQTVRGEEATTICVCVVVLTKTEELLYGHMVTRKEIQRHTSRRFNHNKLALASCVGKPSNSKP